MGTEKHASARAAPDGGWGWVVVFGAFTMLVLTMGVTYTFGIMYVVLLDYFGASKSDTAWIGSIQPCLHYFTGIFAAPLIKRFSWRPVAIAGSIISAVGFASSAAVNSVYLLYLTYGVLTGIGNGLMYVTSMVAVQHYFESKRAMATGITVSGTGVGTLVFGVVAQYLLEKVGWRCTMLIEGGLMLLGILCGALFRPLPSNCDDEDVNEGKTLLSGEVNSFEYGSKVRDDDSSSVSRGYDSADTNSSVSVQKGCCSGFCSECKSVLRETFELSLFKKPLFVLFCLSVMLFTFGYHVPYTYVPDRAIAMHVNPNSASFLVSIMGMLNVFSRLLFGWMSDRSPQIRVWMAAAHLTLGGVISCLIFLFNTYALMVVYSVLFGIFSGCFVSLYPVILVDLFGIENFERSIGLALVVCSVAFLFAAPLSGWIIDLTGSLDAPFYVVGGLQCLGGALFFTMACFYFVCTKRDYEDIKSNRPARRRSYLSESFS